MTCCEQLFGTCGHGLKVHKNKNRYLFIAVKKLQISIHSCEKLEKSISYFS